MLALPPPAALPPLLVICPSCSGSGPISCFLQGIIASLHGGNQAGQAGDLSYVLSSTGHSVLIRLKGDLGQSIVLWKIKLWKIKVKEAEFQVGQDTIGGE